MRVILLLALTMVLSGCRLLPPVPGTPDDEKIIAYLATLDWSSSRLPRQFDTEAVEAWFGKDVFPKDLYRILPRDEYLRWQPEESVGVRRIFRFYVCETDPVTGIAVFTHEFAHAANYIDVFDMPYNEFLSHTLECHQVVLAAKQDPDLAVQLLNRALSLWQSRDVHYFDESHMRARLWLSALLEDREPLEIYRWARDCSKAEFSEVVNKAVGTSPRDVVRRGVTAFARRHFPGDYLPTLLRVRDRRDPKFRLRAFSELATDMKSDHVFYDNVQWQQLKALKRLDRHDKVLELAESMWSKTQGSLLEEAVAEVAFASACVSGDASIRANWDNRNTKVERWDGAALDWKFNRLRSLYEAECIEFTAAIELFKFIREDSYWSHRPSLHDIANGWIDNVLADELRQLSWDWEVKEPGENAESRLKFLAADCRHLGGHMSQTQLRITRNVLLARRGDQAWEMGEFDKADRLYRKAGHGRHRRETAYWKSKRE